MLVPNFQDAAFEDFEAVFASGFLGGCLSVAVHHRKQWYKPAPRLALPLRITGDEYRLTSNDPNLWMVRGLVT